VFIMSTEDAGHDVKSIIIAIVPKFPALVSILGSSAIIRKVYKSPTKRKNIYHRILCGLSCSDILASSCYFLGTWLVPAKKVGGFGLVFGASGNNATCSLSGFLTQFAICSPLYNGTLSWYYLLSIYFNWSERKIRKIEKYFHIIPIGYALISSSIALGLDMYGNVEWLCWIKPDIAEGEEPSNAQMNFAFFQWVFLFGPVWATIAFVTTVMFVLYRKMRENEKKMEKYHFATKRTRPDIDLIKKNLESEGSPDGNKNEDNWGTFRGSSMKNSSSITSDDGKALRTSSLKIKSSGTSQGDGWKKLRKSSKRDDEGWKKLRQSGATAKVSLRDVDVEAQSSDVPTTRTSQSDGWKKLRNSVKMDDEGWKKLRQTGKTAKVSLRDVDVEAQSSEVPTIRTPTNADARDEAESSNEVENRVSFLAESKVVIASPDVEVKRSIEEEFAMKEDFCPDMKEELKLSLVEALANVQTERKRNNVSFKGVPDPVSNGVTSDEKEKSFFSRSDYRMNWSFLSRFSSTHTEVAENNESSALGLSKAALTKKKQLYSKASKSRQIAIQGILYVVAFYITWFFPTLQRITELAVSKNFYVLQFFDTFLLPLQGFLNFGIYIRPRLMKFRKDNPELGFWTSLWKVTYETN